MLSDEEKAVLKTAKENYGLTSAEQKILVNLIEKQSKEIEELSDKLAEKICKGVEEEILEEYRQTIISKDKEIEELRNEVMEKELMIDGMKEDRRIAVEEIQEQYFVSKEESEQRERKAYIKGTNDTDDLCNKKWEDKIKAKIEEVDKEEKENLKGTKGQDRYAIKQEYMYKRSVLQSLLEKE